MPDDLVDFEQPFPCGVNNCQARFANRNRLARHRRHETCPVGVTEPFELGDGYASTLPDIVVHTGLGAWINTSGDVNMTDNSNNVQQAPTIPQRQELPSTSRGRIRYANPRYVNAAPTPAGLEPTETDSPHNTMHGDSSDNDGEPFIDEITTFANSLVNVDSTTASQSTRKEHPSGFYITKPDRHGIYRVYPHPPSHMPDINTTIHDLCDAPALSTPSNPTLDTHSSNAPWYYGMTRSLLNLTPSISNPLAPLTSRSVLTLLSWMNRTSQVSKASVTDLVQNVIRNPHFDPNDPEIVNFNIDAQHSKLENPVPSQDPQFSVDDGWRNKSLEIPVPATGLDHRHRTNNHKYTLPGVRCRSLIDVIAQSVNITPMRSIHLTPFQLYRANSSEEDEPCATDGNISEVPPSAEDEPVYSEMYNSEAFVSEYCQIRQDHQSRTPYEVVMIALMFWSDSTHLADFGTASLWPIYMYFGNISKYVRAKPSSFAAHHIAYLPKFVESDFSAWFYTIFGKLPTLNIIKYVKQSVMHGVWRVLLDSKFRDAWINGVPMKFHDGKIRLVFPRIFTYSADYPEKVLLACIRGIMSGFPCPRCWTHKDYFSDLGTDADHARRSDLRKESDSRNQPSALKKVFHWVFRLGKSVGNKGIKALLQPFSWTSIKNAFTEQLYAPDFNAFNSFDVHQMLVPDLLHEFELGVFKAVFTHLIRVVYAMRNGKTLILLIDERFRQIPTFGRDTIRRFGRETSEMKKLAGRDFEDILQCSMPVFEGIFGNGDLDVLVQDMLYLLATWHAYAKCRLHTQTSVKMLDLTTTALGKILRIFRTETMKLDTQETPKEHERRARAGARRTKHALHQQASSNRTRRTAGRTDGKDVDADAGDSGQKTLNLLTPKFHSLGDYAHTVVQLGTSDSYSTQIGEQEHRRVKKYYKRTNRSQTYSAQIAAQDMRAQRLREIETRVSRDEETQTAARLASGTTTLAPSAEPQLKDFKRRAARRKRKLSRTAASAPVIATDIDPMVSYDMSREARATDSIQITTLHQRGMQDPVFQIFDRLIDHLLARIHGVDYFDVDASTFDAAQRSQLAFHRHRVYEHKMLWLNYTTYDLRREQDVVNPDSHADVMLYQRHGYSTNNFLYARVIGIYHAEVQYVGMFTSRVMDFLHVRWYTCLPSAEWRLPCLAFMPVHSDVDAYKAFGLVDPADVIRGVHILPAFARGMVQLLRNPSVALPGTEDSLLEYCNHYVGIFSDRDVFMRHVGLSIPHVVAVNNARSAATDWSDDSSVAESEVLEYRKNPHAKNVPEAARVVVYARHITEDPGEEGNSIPTQEQTFDSHDNDTLDSRQEVDASQDEQHEEMDLESDLDEDVNEGNEAEDEEDSTKSENGSSSEAESETSSSSEEVEGDEADLTDDDGYAGM